MEVKRRTLESPKMATKTEGEKIIKKDDMVIKGHIKIAKGLRQAKTTRDDQSPKISASSSPSSSSPSSYMMMKIKMGNYKNSIQRSENNTKKMEINHVKNKMVLMNPKHNTEEITDVDNKMMKNKKVWDCESTLYDSFELNSFKRQLDSAISSSARSMSMPHLSRTPPPPPSERTWSLTKKQQSPNKISRSLGKLVKSMFRQKEESNATFKAGHGRGVDMDKYFVVFDKTGSLTTIPESGESTKMVGSEINSLVRKTTSERFPRSRLVGVSCY
ncbi:PREDICTED: uncharacterized protein LOC104753102 isoform X2 [Camelina sativa]|uniref:Uncharacterized protein LOC104753102 isoform X2 n=1 Tax=Camelina sativa TaxID=90675 RepID=A0ABM0WNK9_CAMSA|nr:PREDICTED: uncharacterized protein LOC104753102 isoform X2 [Camelina sativa]